MSKVNSTFASHGATINSSSGKITIPSPIILEANASSGVFVISSTLPVTGFPNLITDLFDFVFEDDLSFICVSGAFSDTTGVSSSKSLSDMSVSR